MKVKTNKKTIIMLFTLVIAISMFTLAIAISILMPTSIHANLAPNRPVKFMSDEAYSKLPFSKKKLIDREEEMIYKAREGIIPQAKKTNKSVVQEKHTTWPQGINNEPEQLPGFNEVTVMNIWRGTIGNKHYSVYAGYKTAHNTEGVLIVHELTSDNSTIGFHEVESPKKNDGGLKVIKDNGNTIILQSTSGSQYTFDVQSHMFK